jgi:hypothetical protein
MTHKESESMVTHRQITERQATVISSSDRFTVRLASDFAKWCIALARAAHLDGTARLMSLRSNTIAFVVSSRNREREYEMVADFAGTVWCEGCVASKHNRACCHCGAVYHYLRQMAQACREYGSASD